MQQDIAETPVLLNAWAWFEKNRKQVIWGGIALAVIAFITAYISISKKEKEKAAGEALSRAVITSAMGRRSSAENAEDLLKVVSANGGTQAGAQALLLAASAMFSGGKYAEAQSSFERFNREYAGDVMTAQAIFGVGACLAAQGKLEEAARSLKDVTIGIPIQRSLLWRNPHWLASMNRKAKVAQALALYEDVASKSAGTTLGNEAAVHAESLRAKLPPVSVAPAADATATNAAPVAK